MKEYKNHYIGESDELDRTKVKNFSSNENIKRNSLGENSNQEVGEKICNIYIWLTYIIYWKIYKWVKI